MPRCPHCDTTLDVDDLESHSVEHFVDVWVCPACDAILGMGEIRGG